MAENKLLDGKRVLAVDDEQDVLDTLVDLLPMCELVTAPSFEEARELLESQPFDLVILDIMGVDGYGLLEIATRKNIPAVMLTAGNCDPQKHPGGHADRTRLEPGQSGAIDQRGRGVLFAQRRTGKHHRLFNGCLDR
jgi:CheY-like chemotaxis protein